MSTAPAVQTPSNQCGLGIARCTACSEGIAVVGQLHPDGCCSVCGHDLDGYDVLADELRHFIQPWLAACKERGISREMIASAWDELDVKTFHDPDGVPA